MRAKDKLNKDFIAVFAVSSTLVLLFITTLLCFYNVHQNNMYNESAGKVERYNEEYSRHLEELDLESECNETSSITDRITKVEYELKTLGEDKDSYELYDGTIAKCYYESKDLLTNKLVDSKNKIYDLYSSSVNENIVETDGLSEDDCNYYKSKLSDINSELNGAKEVIFDKFNIVRYCCLASKIYTANNSYDSRIAKIEEERRIAEEQARALNASNRTVYNGSNRNSGVWSPSYYNDYYTDSAASDGSLTQWADGYYIAHNWSANGKMISSKSSQIYINGKLYNYCSSIEIPRNQTWNESMQSYVYKNGGVGFQTCIDGGGYLVNHYEPAN